MINIWNMSLICRILTVTVRYTGFIWTIFVGFIDTACGWLYTPSRNMLLS